jgi:hypothetical protein
VNEFGWFLGASMRPAGSMLACLRSRPRDGNEEAVDDVAAWMSR